jgi:predicted Zn-dependent protease
MNLKLLFFLALLALSTFFYLYVENPGTVAIVLAKGHSYTLPLVLLLVISFVAGVVMMGLDALISDTVRTLRAKKARKAAKAVEEAKKTYWRGLEAMARADYAAARELIEKALLAVPGDLPMVLSLAETHMREGNPHEAMEAIETELFHNPSSVALLTALGTYARKAGETERAERAFEEVLKVEKDNEYATRELRDIKIDQEKWSEAIPLEEKLLESRKKGWFRGGGHDSGKLPGLLYEKARALYAEGNLDKAEAVLKEALRKDDDFVPSNILFGEIYKEKYGAYEGLMVWEKAYSLAPGSAALLFRIEDYQVEASAPQKMIELYKRELETRPDDINLRLLLARFYLRVEMVERAVEELEKLRDEGRESYYSKVLLGAAYKKQGYDARAAEIFGELLGVGKGSDTRPSFTCANCSTTFRQWSGRCGFCGEWATLHMNPEAR